MAGYNRFVLGKTKVGKKLMFRWMIIAVVIAIYYFVLGETMLLINFDDAGQMLKVVLCICTGLLLPFMFIMGFLYVTVIELCNLIEKYDEILMKKGLLDKSLLE
jgi:hypothetical protein